METGTLTNAENLDSPMGRPRTRHPRICTIEPVLFVVFLAASMSGEKYFNHVLETHLFADNVVTDLYLKQTCQVEMSLNATVCDALGTDTPQGHDAEAIVQPDAAYYFQWKSGLQNLVPALLSLFLGPWSDRYGRKPIIVLSLTGKF